MDHDTHQHDLGLAHDLATMHSLSLVRRFDRRDALKVMGGLSLLALAGCGSDRSATATSSTSAAGASTTAAATSTQGASCAVIPQETAGPYPGDGTNGPDALTSTGVVRSDITKSFGTFGSNAAAGVPLTIVLRIQDQAKGCTPIDGAAVYLWHCDMNGKYSMYDLKTENYLRGVQAAGADGTVTFRSIYPGAYSGRYPHIHFEVFDSIAKATAGGPKRRTSQLAMPAEASTLVYATTGYEQSVRNNARTTLASDMVFSDDKAVHQIPTYTGDAKGITVMLDVPV
jgi:protocatechuate 3,4-dioxygenase beta subunit